MLTHNVLARKQGYQNLTKVFRNNDDYVKKKDDYISFFSYFLEPAAIAFLDKKYGEMFQLLGIRTPKIKCHQDKMSLANDMERLCELRSNANIGDVIEHLLAVKRPHLPDKIEKREDKYQQIKKMRTEEIEEKDKELLDKLNKLKAVSYKEMIVLAKFIREETPFSTKHGVKGEEYENVFVVFGRGWNQYNFGNFLELKWKSTEISESERDFHERNRNLFMLFAHAPLADWLCCLLKNFLMKQCKPFHLGLAIVRFNQLH